MAAGRNEISDDEEKGRTEVKILFFQWHSFMNRGMERALKELDIEYQVFFYQLTDWEKDDIFLGQFEQELKKERYDGVLSVNFVPLISVLCEEIGIPYTAWVYDSPLHIRDLSVLGNSCNRIFFFDRGQAEAHRKDGVNAMHMPLAVDTEVFRVNASQSQKKGYRTEVSLVGKLYQTEYAGYAAPLGEYTRGYLEGIINSQGKIYGGYLIPELVTEALLDRVNADYKSAGVDFCMGGRELEFMLACETTGRERYTALALLSKHYQVDLYSTDEEVQLAQIRHRGYADYYTQMPLVFSQSKINLNISLKTIRTGIPLRVTDVMGCCGFVLTNYQPELEEHFKIGEDCVVYDNMEDLFAKAAYYLAHETERKRIAEAGFERVKRDFTFRDRLERMLNKEF